MTKYSDILSYLRKREGLSQQELAEKTGLKRSAISMYETAQREPDLETFEIFADFFNVDMNTLTGKSSQSFIPCTDNTASTPTDFTPPEKNMIKKYRTLDEHGKDMVDTVLDKEYERVGAAAGTDAAEIEPEIEYIRHYFVPAAAGYVSPIEGEDFELIAKDDSVPAEADFCIDIQGDSMEPYIKDGQRVYVQRDAPMSDFDVGVFFVDGSVYCKQYCIDHVGNLYLLSANRKREDANKTILATSGSTVVCYGKVILKKKLPEPYYD